MNNRGNVNVICVQELMLTIQFLSVDYARKQAVENARRANRTPPPRVKQSVLPQLRATTVGGDTSMLVTATAPVLTKISEYIVIIIDK
jgi:hypothetical protein